MATRRAQRLFETVRHLRPAQGLYFVRRRFMRPAKVRAPDPAGIETRPLKFAEPIARNGLIDSATNTARFLNVQRELGRPVDWAPQDMNRLWRYNLHYFEYLAATDLGREFKAGLIDQWIAANPQGSVPAWEPYTASLRIQNWCKYLIQNPDELQREGWLASLCEQALWLEKNLELHILANHYFENLVALVFAGSLFRGADAERWLNTGLAGVREQLDEQTLRDGGHYERSPAYHCVMLEKTFDLYNLGSRNRSFFEPGVIDLLQEFCANGLFWLEEIIMPDGRIPLFNDSAFGAGPELAELSAYAGRLFGRHKVQGWFSQQSPTGLIDKPDSGLYGYRAMDDMFLIDCGDIGPAYQPGHTHCDFLSYELALEGRRVIVDTGVCEYEPGPRRSQVRSTRAHNTLSVDDAEQSQIWGEFRVARRARKLGAAIDPIGVQAVQFSGAMKGFWDIPKGINHRREVSLALDGGIRRIEIRDMLEGESEKNHRIESRVHFHPDLTIEQRGGHQLELARAGQPVARLTLPADVEWRLEDSIYCPEFGKAIKNQCLVMEAHSTLPWQSGYSIEKL